MTRDRKSGMLRESREEGKGITEIIRGRNPNPPEVRATLLLFLSIRFTEDTGQVAVGDVRTTA